MKLQNLMLFLLCASLSLLGCNQEKSNPSNFNAILPNWNTSPPSAPPTNPTPPVIPPLSSSALKQLQNEIDTILTNPKLAGHIHSVLVVEHQTGKTIYASHPDTPLIPASNTKMFTTAAALELLGENYRFTTKVYASAPINSQGVLNGHLYLFSEHDFTFSKRFYPSPRTPFDYLAKKLYRQGLRRIQGNLYVYGAYCYEGDNFARYSPAKHRKRAEDNFLAALKNANISLQGKTTNLPSFRLPPNLIQLAVWKSPPLWVACSPINRISHNEMADILCRHLGYKFKGISSYKAGTQVVLTWAKTKAKIDVSQAKLYDGSGLDTRNRLSARHLVQLVRYMQNSPVAQAWNSTLSIAGVRGTFAYRMKGPNTKGRFFGKSGTNHGICTTGFLVHKYDNFTYVISVLMNKLPGGSSSYKEARKTQNQVVEAVAKNWRKIAPPPPPTLLSVKNQATGHSLQLNWKPVPQAQGYWIYTSSDGKTYQKKIYTQNPSSYTLTNLPPNQTLYVYITATSPQGESLPSDAYAASVGFQTSDILIVDGYDRWQREPAYPENALGAAHRFATLYAQALAAYPKKIMFDTVANEEIEQGTTSLATYKAVLWFVGEDSKKDDSLSLQEQQRLQRYLQNGGNLFLSGAEIAWDLAHSTNPKEQNFLRNTLRASYQNDNADTFIVQGSGILNGLEWMEFYTPGAILVSYPDVIQPLAGATTCLKYYRGKGTTAALQYQGNYRLVYFAFPWESLSVKQHRQIVLSKILQFFSL